MTGNGINRGLAFMPGQERSPPVGARGLSGDPSANERRHREAMARNPSSQGTNQGSTPRAGAPPGQWDDAEWDSDHDEAAGHRARRLLSGSNSSLHRIGDKFSALQRWLGRERWVR